MKRLFFLLSVASVALFSCNSSSNNENSDSDSAVVEETGNASSTGKKYSMEKGMVKYTMEVMGMKTSSILWFDAFGQKECMETSAEMMGMKSTSRQFKKDGFAYNINMDAKTGTKIKINTDQFDPTDMKFDDLTDEIKTKYNLKEEGSESFMGKDCKIWSIDYQGSKGKFWVWNNIALKTEMSSGGLKIEMKAIEFSENPTLPAGIFDVPQGVTITETNMNDAMKGMGGK
jgi:hypothetical protein